jgi:hypothetical protein
MKLRRWINQAAIEHSMSKPAPARIPMSGKDRLQERDYFVVYLGDDRDPLRFLVQRIDNGKLHGIWFIDGPDQREDRTVSIEDASQYDLSITQYFAELEIPYKSGAQLLLWNALYLPLGHLIASRFAKYLYGRKTLIRSDRMAVLNRIVDESINRHDFRVSSVTLLLLLHGDRAFLHPKRDAMLRYYDYIIESLTEARELVSDDQSKTVGPNALNSLAKYEQENRRHEENVSQQRAIKWLTIVIAAAAITQAVISWVK